MKTLKDGGPAFPVTIQHGSTMGLPGLTLRDYFAAAALQGFMASDDPARTAKLDLQNLAYDCYDIADAMLAQRRFAEEDQS